MNDVMMNANSENDNEIKKLEPSEEARGLTEVGANNVAYHYYLGNCGVVGSILAVGSTGCGFELRERLFVSS